LAEKQEKVEAGEKKILTRNESLEEEKVLVQRGRY
jgi:hypothetical protein